MTPRAKATPGDHFRRWWPIVVTSVGAVAMVVGVVWATSGEQSDTLRRVQTIETWKDEHPKSDGHNDLSRRVTEQGAHLGHLKERADKADTDRGVIINSVGRLENSSARMEAILESLERRTRDTQR